MSHLSALYKNSLALHTDLYQLTMAYGYWKARMVDKEATFHLSFRENPFHSGFTVACGLHTAVELLNRFRFQKGDLDYLATLQGNDGDALFEEGFLSYLGDMELKVHVDAIPEGTVVFPNEPLVRVTGPLMQCQLLETCLLNCLNFETLIATKSARICLAARGDTVLEFGLRRAQGIDGALSASRAAYVGGCGATSNVLAGKLFGIPVRGTHAHSWVMCFVDERSAFDAYAHAMPNNCVFLVDTYDTIQGVRHAVEIGRELRKQGHEMLGVRLDSGDLAYLSIEARKILDEAGFPDTAILASNDLDEHIITSLKQQEATVSIWGVGTRLATAYDQPALGGVYKLSAIREADQPWHYKVKLSEQANKISNPGIQQVRRFYTGEEPMADMIFDVNHDPKPPNILVDPIDPTRRKNTVRATSSEDLLIPIFRQGKQVYDPPPVTAVRDRTLAQLNRFHDGVKRLANPHQYPVGLEQNLFNMRNKLILEARGEPACG